MGRGKLTSEEIESLKHNPYVISVDSTSIRYSDDFKKLFIRKYLDGERPSAIFRGAGFDTAALGTKRIERACARWRELYCSGALDLEDCGNDGDRSIPTIAARNGGFTSKEPMKAAEQIKMLQARIKKQERIIRAQRDELREMKRKISKKG